MNLLIIDLSNIPCWLIPLLAGLICAILGYLLGRLFGKSDDSNDDLDLWKRKNASLQADLDMCRSQLNATTEAPAVASSTASMASSFAAETAAPVLASIAFDAAAAKAAFGKSIKEDDLTVVEGIGPKIKELFHNFDINTWASLADTPIEKCQEVLNSGGKRFEIHRPNTWPMQAGLAAQGKWAELKKWQDEHDYGKA